MGPLCTWALSVRSRRLQCLCCVGCAVGQPCPPERTTCDTCSRKCLHVTEAKTGGVSGRMLQAALRWRFQVINARLSLILVCPRPRDTWQGASRTSLCPALSLLLSWGF